MLLVVLVVGALLLVAGVSALAAHRGFGVTAWSLEYGEKGIGLTIELAVLSLVAFVGVAISIIMADSFRMLFLGDWWRSYWYVYVGIACVASGLVVIYHVSAARSLAKKHHLDEADARRECLLPYAAYTPYSMVLCVGLVLPVLALLVVSVRSDHGDVAAARRALANSGAQVLVVAEREPEAAEAYVAIYGLEYLAAVDGVQRTVGRYLWVVGVFLGFLIVILNTRITSAYSDVAVEIFKWLMWILLLVAVGVCLWGLARYQALRNLAIATHESLVASASDADQLDLVVAGKEALLEIRQEGPARVLRGGFIALLLLVGVSNTFQFLIAKATHRSALHVIFPSNVARFLDGFLLRREEPPATRK